MVDNVAANPSSGGFVFKTDDASGVHWPSVKIAFGGDDVQTEVEATVGLPVAPFSAIIETGIQQIIGINDAAMTQDEYSSTLDLSLGGTFSGEILGFILSSFFETGGSGINEGSGTLYFFDADPNTTSGDTALATFGSEHNTVIATVKIAAADWDSDANGAVLQKTVAIPFHALATIHVVYRNTDATVTWNAAGADDQRLNINMWFRRDS